MQCRMLSHKVYKRIEILQYSRLNILGAGLAFIAYPEAVTRLPISRFWAILFFTMLSTLGFGTQFTLIESVVSTVSETIYSAPSRSQKRTVLVFTCLSLFCCGFVLCTHVSVFSPPYIDSLDLTFFHRLVCTSYS